MRLRTKFQDEDFDLGEVVEANVYYGGSGKIKVVVEPTKGEMISFYFGTLKGMTEMFEDYEEPEEDGLDNIINLVEAYNSVDGKRYPKEIVDKLEAWKRLKNKGFRFDGYDVAHKSNGNLAGQIFYDAGDCCIEDVEKDLNLLFGGEE